MVERQSGFVSAFVSVGMQSMVGGRRKVGSKGLQRSQHLWAGSGLSVGLFLWC